MFYVLIINKTKSEPPTHPICFFFTLLHRPQNSMYQSIIMIYDDADVMVCIQTPYLKLQKKSFLQKKTFFSIVCYQTTHLFHSKHTKPHRSIHTQK